MLDIKTPYFNRRIRLSKKSISDAKENIIFHLLPYIVARENPEKREDLSYFEKEVKQCKAMISFYYIPKNWKKTDLYKKKKLKNCLTEDITEKNISTTTVKKYLRAFKEFLTYAQRKGYVSLALNVQLEIPSRETRESYKNAIF